MHDSIHPGRLARSWRLPLVAAILLSGVLVAGCAGSSPSRIGATSGGTSSSAPLAFSKCMRANGVPEFPDLTSTGMRIGGIGVHGQTVSVNGVSVNAPSFTAALQKCEPHRQRAYASPAQTAQQIQQGLQFARCMRRYGVPDFPDPELRTGAGGNQVAYLPGVNIEAPAVQFAAKACGGGPKGP